MSGHSLIQENPSPDRILLRDGVSSEHQLRSRSVQVKYCISSHILENVISVAAPGGQGVALIAVYLDVVECLCSSLASSLRLLLSKHC